MKLLLDNGTPAPLRRYLGDHEIRTAAQLGWATLANGDLLDRAEEAGYEVLKDDAELFKQFMDNDGFKRWMTDTVFALAYDRPVTG